MTNKWPRFVVDAMQVLSYPYWEEGGDEPVVEFERHWGGLDTESILRATREASGDELILAVVLLAKSGDPATADELTRLQAYPKERDVRWWSALLLAELEDKRARPALEVMLTENLPTPETFSEPPARNEEAHERLLKRARAAHFLGQLGGPLTIVLLRRTLERTVALEGVLPVEIESFILNWLHQYQSALVTSLGQLGALGALTNLQIPDPAVWVAHHQSPNTPAEPSPRFATRPGWHLAMLCIDLVMGHLRKQFDPKLLYSHGAFSFGGVPELREELAVQLRRIFGWEETMVEYALANYEVHRLGDLSFY